MLMLLTVLPTILQEEMLVQAKKRIRVIRLVTVAVLSAASVSAQSTNDHRRVATNDNYRPFLINNFFVYYGNNGDGAYNTFVAEQPGLEYPKGSNKSLVYEEGVVWGGYHRGVSTPKVGGSAYRPGLQAGRITTPGTLFTDPVAVDASMPANRVYRVRPDVHPGVPFDDVRSTLETGEYAWISRYQADSVRQIYDQYIKDWNEWPAAEGAPYADMDHNGIYEPGTDVPGHPGADQTLWYVANDVNPARTSSVAGSNIIGLEMQRTIWGYDLPGALGSTIFSSTVLINKSGDKVDSMFLVQWSDPDLGGSGDDYAGCDTTRGLGFVYNGANVDGVYGVAVPAVGYLLLQGPVVSSPGDSAMFLSRWRRGFRNLPMSAFDFFVNGSGTYADPQQGAGGDVQWYRLMKARIASNGNPFIDPTTGKAARFCLYGDPVAGTGWRDGTNGLTPGDRRICLITGPFTFADRDTQEIVIAAIAGLGADRISSVLVLKSYADQVANAFKGGIGPATSVYSPIVPVLSQLDQNYPNPFNPITAVSYQLSVFSKTKIAVYDMLGREVVILVNELKSPGRYEVAWDATGYASGVYLCRMTAGGASATRKLMLVR
jgi:hypothetical protein